MANYYDVVLALVPLVLATVTGTLILSGTTLTSAVSAGALATLPIIGHAMFVRTPDVSSADQLPDAPAQTGDSVSSAD
jgi:hypothetical protein